MLVHRIQDFAFESHFRVDSGMVECRRRKSVGSAGAKRSSFFDPVPAKRQDI